MIINTMLFYYLLILTSPTNCLSIFDHFVGLALKGLKYYLKKREQHNKGALFYNSGFRHLLNACIEDWSKFHAELVCFLFFFFCFFIYLFFFFGDEKNYFWKHSWPVLLSLGYWSLDLPRYGSELWTKYTLRVLLIYSRVRRFLREGQGNFERGESCSSWGEGRWGHSHT